MKLTKEEAIRRHRMMWEWIANETLKKHECVDKKEAFEHFGWSRITISHCWCCEYTNSADEDGSCGHCPVIWPSKASWMQCMDYENATPFDGKGIYVAWAHALAKNDWRTAAYYALYISMLPERKD